MFAMNVGDVDALLVRLDARHPGLKKVITEREEGNTRNALGELIEHFRNRSMPNYLFGDSDISRFDDPSSIEEAERVCNHEILGHCFGKQIDWRFNATAETSRDSEWTWSLVRHNFWVPLARAYGLTKQEKYAREFVNQLKSFVAAWPVEPHMDILQANMNYPGDAWRSIDAAIRIYTAWLPAMAYFQKSPSWDEEGWFYFLHSIYEHAEFLCTHYSNHTHCSNWLTMECSALFQLGVMFPEFRRAPEWKKLGYQRVCHEIRYQFDHYGVHMERTPVYHLVSTLAFLQAYRLAVLNDVPVPPYMLPILERSAEFLMQLVKPDFTLPMIGDADRISLSSRKADQSPYEGMNLTIDPVDLNEIRAFFSTMADLTGREDFAYFASGRRQGSPPQQLCFSLPDPGFYIFRTGWQETDSYFLVTGTQIERGSNGAHSHSDAAHLELQVEGEDVLIDTGRYLYGNCSRLDWWQYFQSTRAHTTLEVDSRPMAVVPDTSPEVRCLRTFCHRFESSPKIDLVEVSHNGYAFLPEPVFHLRRVFYFKPSLWLIDDVITGIGKHEYRLCFNFAPGQLEAIDGDPGTYTFSGTRVRIRCLPLLKQGLSTEVFAGSPEPKGGWVSYAYSEKVPIPQLIYKKQGCLPARFVTVMYREQRGSAVLADSKGIDRLEIELDSAGNLWNVVLDFNGYTINEA
jgi:hypothetical protein